MAHAESTITIARPIGEVFAYLADGLNNPKWRSGVLSIAPVSTVEGVGASYRQVLSGPGGRKIDGDYTVTESQPPHRLAFAVTAGPARPTGVYELTEAGGGTVVRFALELQPTGMMRLMAPMISKQMTTEVAQLSALKAVLERAS